MCIYIDEQKICMEPTISIQIALLLTIFTTFKSCNMNMMNM